MGADGGIVVVSGFKDAEAARRFEELVPYPISYWDKHRAETNDPARDADRTPDAVIWSYGSSQEWDVEHLETILGEEGLDRCGLTFRELGELASPFSGPASRDCGFALACKLAANLRYDDRRRAALEGVTLGEWVQAVKGTFGKRGMRVWREETWT